MGGEVIPPPLYDDDVGFEDGCDVGCDDGDGPVGYMGGDDIPPLPVGI